MDSTMIVLGYIVIPLILIIGTVLWVLQRRRNQYLTQQLEENKKEIGHAKHQLNDKDERIRELEEEQHGEEDTEKLKSNVEFTLKRALKRSKEENFQKNTFLSSLSSEIRTPLNNIIGFASLLETEISLLENKELFEYARGISESGDRLTRLLNNIIDISKIESHDVDITIKPCSISAIVTSVAQLYTFKANDQKIKFNIINKDIPDALVDDKVLTRVLGGILDNAIKYTEKGFVNISSDYIKKSNEIIIRVKDSGSGIDPSYLKEIFNAFRPDSPGYSKEEQGTRLGLPIAKQLIEMMDSRLEIESEKGKGTSVSIFLKAEGEIPEVAEIESEPEEEIEGPTKTKILQDLDIFIVEDDLMNSMVLVEMTKSLGEVTTAVNGEVTLKIVNDKHAQGKHFTIMLFDINLPPPYDGIKLMQKIRKEIPAYQKIPFIAQTAYAMTGDREKLLEAGFDDYIPKPINKNELYTIMKHQLEMH